MELLALFAASVVDDIVLLGCRGAAHRIPGLQERGFA
jgi:hypothetical protein